MMLTKLNLRSATVVISLLCTSISTMLFVTSVSAATPNPGITVSPAKLSFILSKDAPLQKIEVTVTNNYDSPISMAADFKGIDENAGLLIPTETPDQPFVAALVLSETSVQLLPHVSKRLTVQLNNVAALAPGGVAAPWPLRAGSTIRTVSVKRWRLASSCRRQMRRAFRSG